MTVPLDELNRSSGDQFAPSPIEVPSLGQLYILGVQKAGGGQSTWTTERDTGAVFVAKAGGGLASWPAAGAPPNLSTSVALADGGAHSWPLAAA